MPKIECSAHAVAASAAILDAVSEGALTPGDAAEISKLVKPAFAGWARFSSVFGAIHL
jgi:hypothetical protein